MKDYKPRDIIWIMHFTKMPFNLIYYKYEEVWVVCVSGANTQNVLYAELWVVAPKADGLKIIGICHPNETRTDWEIWVTEENHFMLDTLGALIELKKYTAPTITRGRDLEHYNSLEEYKGEPIYDYPPLY